MLPALAFVPANLVRKVFEGVALRMREEEPCLTSLLEYFEANYIGTITRDPRFEIAIWNQWDRAGEYVRRTNNNVEGWHRALTSTMGISNPTIWKFFGELKKRIQYQTREIERISRKRFEYTKKSEVGKSQC